MIPVWFRKRTSDLRVYEYTPYRHTATVSPAPLMRRFGEHQCVAELEDRSACTACGNRDGNSVKIYKLER